MNKATAFVFLVVICSTNFVIAQTWGLPDKPRKPQVSKRKAPAKAFDPTVAPTYSQTASRPSSSQESLTALNPTLKPAVASIPYNEARVFPLKAAQGAVHAGYTFGVSDNIAVGIEGSYMPSYSASYFYIHRPGEKYRENFAGVLGQYYFSELFDGIYVEAGVNYLQAEVEIDDGVRAAREYSSPFVSPHISVGYKFRFPFGLTLGAGGGAGMYFGEDLPAQQRFNYTTRTYSTEEDESPYRNNKIEGRIRAEVGIAF